MCPLMLSETSNVVPHRSGAPRFLSCIFVRTSFLGHGVLEIVKKISDEFRFVFGSRESQSSPFSAFFARAVRCCFRSANGLEFVFAHALSRSLFFGVCAFRFLRTLSVLFDLYLGFFFGRKWLEFNLVGMSLVA